MKIIREQISFRSLIQVIETTRTIEVFLCLDESQTDITHSADIVLHFLRFVKRKTQKADAPT